MGRKMCVVLLKSGKASLSVRGSGVCMSMKDMEGRRRTMCELGYLLRTSRSRYLVKRLALSARDMMLVGFMEPYSSQNAMLCNSISRRYGLEVGGDPRYL